MSQTATKMLEELKHIQQKLRSAQETVRLPSHGHTQYLEEAKKSLIAFKKTHHDKLNGLILWPESFYSTNGVELIGSAQGQIRDFENGHGWCCLDEASNFLTTLSDLIEGVPQ